MRNELVVLVKLGSTAVSLHKALHGHDVTHLQVVLACEVGIVHTLTAVDLHLVRCRTVV